MAKAQVISRNEFFDGMVAACPTFEPNWLRFKEEWTGNPELLKDGSDGTLPHYLLLSELADHLIDMLESSETQSFPEIFSVIEDWVVHWEHYVSEAAVVGLLEDLTAASRYKASQPSDFIRWLGPVSRKWWIELIAYWKRVEGGQFRRLCID